MKYCVLCFLMVVSIPAFLGINAWQANECEVIKSEIKDLELSQENMVEENKTVIAEIADLISVNRLETVAQEKLGLRKNRPGDVTLIIMGGKGRGH